MGKKLSEVIIDAHAHVGAWFQGKDLIKMMDDAKVDKAVVFPFPAQWSMQTKENYYNSNDYIAEMQNTYPERLIGFGYINPYLSGYKDLGMPNVALKELERCMVSLDLKGIKIHPEVNSFPMDMLIGSEFMKGLDTLQKKIKRNIVIMAHGMTTIGCMPDQFGKVAAAYPKVQIIIAHGAGFQNLYFPNYSAVKENDNLYADTSMCTIDDGHMVGVASQIGVKNVIFGTDHFGTNQTFLYDNYFHVLKNAFPRSEDLKMILAGNIAKILGIKI
jgi:uncharacterized protein